MRALLVVGLTFAAILPIVVIIWASRPAKPGPPRELAQAARLLDRVRASDDAIPQLPIGLRREVDAFLDRFYKEISK